MPWQSAPLKIRTAEMPTFPEDSAFECDAFSEA